MTRGPMTQAATVPALKEWGAVVHALLAGRQSVLLRKGGIGEKRFEVAAREFMFFPTVAHSHAERVRPECQDLLTAAAGDSADDRVVVRAAAKVVAALPVNRPDNIEAIEDLHIWTAQSVREDRLDFRPKHRLAVLVVRPSLWSSRWNCIALPTTPAAPAGCSCLCGRRWVLRCRTRRHYDDSLTGFVMPSDEVGLQRVYGVWSTSTAPSGRSPRVHSAVGSAAAVSRTTCASCAAASHCR